MSLEAKLRNWSAMIYAKVDSFLIFGVLWSHLLRWCTSRWPHSGFQKPPMYGDFEAHRHWMEITVNLPAKEWYKNSSSNDLQYWGLDYPPLSAYQSMICGYIAKWIDPQWITLNSSRGLETYELRNFMRTTAVVLDTVLFTLPVVIYWLSIPNPSNSRNKAIATTMMLLYPGFILIDHGHFQYNTVCLGLVCMALSCMVFKYDLIGACMFTLSLHYKQMSLYYSLPIFFYLLRSCFDLPWKRGFLKFCMLSITVILTSALCWAPYLRDFETFMQVVRRLFPVDRGLYEDKVANFWCCISIFIKLKNLFPKELLVWISGASTLLAALPSSILLFRRPSYKGLLLGLVNSSLIFFLLSYQVHEKTILFVAFPVLLLVEEYPLACVWFCYISAFSLVPLLVKDGITTPFVALSTMFIAGSLEGYDGFGFTLRDRKASLPVISMFLSIFGSIILVIAMSTVKPPKRYPDLHVLLNCIYCCIHFICFAIYFHLKQFQLVDKTKATKKTQ